jgi:hypothetical protein
LSCKHFIFDELKQSKEATTEKKSILCVALLNIKIYLLDVCFVISHAFFVVALQQVFFSSREKTTPVFSSVAENCIHGVTQFSTQKFIIISCFFFFFFLLSSDNAK